MTAAAVPQPSSPQRPLHPPRRRRAWWLVAGVVLAAACAAALSITASPPGGVPWVVWARPAADQTPASGWYTLYDDEDVRLTPGGVRDELGWTPGGTSIDSHKDLLPALWRNEQGGRVRRLVDELLRRRRGTRCYTSIGVQRPAGGDPLQWDAFVLDGPFRDEIRAASADPDCVGSWDVRDGNGDVVRWTLAADGIVTGPAGGGGWGVRDGVLAMWAAPTTSSPVRVAGLLSDDGASFDGHTRGSNGKVTAIHGVRVVP